MRTMAVTEEVPYFWLIPHIAADGIAVWRLHKFENMQLRSYSCHIDAVISDFISTT